MLLDLCRGGEERTNLGFSITGSMECKSEAVILHCEDTGEVGLIGPGLYISMRVDMSK